MLARLSRTDGDSMAGRRTRYEEQLLVSPENGSMTLVVSVISGAVSVGV